MELEARTVDGMARIGARAWGRLDTDGNPFLSYGFLNALEASGSVAPDNGWQPFHLCIYQGKKLVAAAPSYIKGHSRGEFVFDWAWADAYHRNQLPYYPKLLTAVPWTPVTGPRLLVAKGTAQPGPLREALVRLALERCEDLGLYSWHCNFVTPQDQPALEAGKLLARRDCQFHWHNRGYACFDDFLATLKSKKRKNIRHERQQVADAGIRFERIPGDALDRDQVAFIHRCYRRTFHAHGNHPALTLPCFESMVAELPGALLAVIAHDAEGPLAMSLYLMGAGVFYGRYWGTLREVRGLHFETAYYQGIEYCIEAGLDRFESGAQGEHKIARGFEAEDTCSYHHIAHPGFRAAIARFLEQETEWVEAYSGEVTRHEPFKVVSGT
jgi:predicted N-acyltransferase